MSSKRNHPQGLKYLFFTEMWERFGYYLMIGIFFLFMIDGEGLQMTKTQASDIFGTFIALVYLTPFIGGLLADRVLGYRFSISLGGILMGVGYMMLAIPGNFAFIAALMTIIVGNGFFKPNISTLLGNLYNEEPYKQNKDAGYNIFYMGINLGAFICNFVAAYLRIKYGWGYAFIAAGIGMFIGVIIFWLGMKHYAHADVRKPVQKEDMSLGKIFGIVLLPAVIFGTIGWFIPDNIFGSDSTDAFLVGTIPVVLFYVSLWARASKEDKAPIGALLAIMGVVVVFWAIFKQNGTALTTWAEFYTDRTIPEALAGPADAAGMAQEISVSKDTFIVYDEQFRAQTDGAGSVVKDFRTNPYYNNIDPELWPEEGETEMLVSTELYQSVNPFFIILLTPLVVMFWNFLRRRKKEPSTPGKIGWGLVVTALSTLVMAAAVIYSDNGLIKASAWWLISSYAVITIGELFLSPMGLSLVSKLSPPRFTALLMGGWLLSTAIGNKLSGVLASMWDQYDEKQYFFMVNFGGAMLAAIAIFMMLPWLRRVINTHLGQ